MGRKGSTPSAIRSAFRAELEELLPEMVGIILDKDENAGARVRAFETLARYGLGVADQAAVHVHAEGNVMLGVVTLPELGSWEPPEEPAEEVQAVEVQALAPGDEG